MPEPNDKTAQPVDMSGGQPPQGQPLPNQGETPPESEGPKGQPEEEGTLEKFRGKARSDVEKSYAELEREYTKTRQRMSQMESYIIQQQAVQQQQQQQKQPAQPEPDEPFELGWAKNPAKYIEGRARKIASEIVQQTVGSHLAPLLAQQAESAREQIKSRIADRWGKEYAEEADGYILRVVSSDPRAAGNPNAYKDTAVRLFGELNLFGTQIREPANNMERPSSSAPANQTRQTPNYVQEIAKREGKKVEEIRDEIERTEKGQPFFYTK
jgi:hypothetical protein